MNLINNDKCIYDDEQLDLFDMTPPEVKAALDMWREINANPRKWARFEVIQSGNSRRVWVEWGNYYPEAEFKEIAIQTISFGLDSEGKVYSTKHTHY